MHIEQRGGPTEPLRTRAFGRVAHASASGVEVGSSSFAQFVHAQLAAVPEEERLRALVWLAQFGGALAPKRGG